MQAHGQEQSQLTGPAYVWILPSFYDPRWWEMSEDEIARLHPSQQCSNYEMEEILNTTHVFSIGIYNYQYESLDSGWPQSVNLVRCLHPLARNAEKCVHVSHTIVTIEV